MMSQGWHLGRISNQRKLLKRLPFKNVVHNDKIFDMQNLAMWPGVLYTDDTDNDKAWLYRLFGINAK